MTLPARNLARAQAAWGDPLPEWIAALAHACDATSQGRVAKRLGISPAVVNQALGAAYEGDMHRLKARCEGEFLNATLACPVLGECSVRRCQDERARPFAATNSLRVTLWRACRKCPNGGQS